MNAEPPALTSGSVTPVGGSSPVATPTCPTNSSPSNVATPVHSRLPN